MVPSVELEAVTASTNGSLCVIVGVWEAFYFYFILKDSHLQVASSVLLCPRSLVAPVNYIKNIASRPWEKKYYC